MTDRELTATAFTKLCEVHLALGDLAWLKPRLEEVVSLADASGVAHLKIRARTTVAMARWYGGEKSDVVQMIFDEAERIRTDEATG